MGLLRWLRPKVRVPPGHKVVITSFSPSPAFARLESGLRIAEFGESPVYGPQGYMPVFDAAEKDLRLAPQTSIVWHLQEKAVRIWTSDVEGLKDWLWRFHQVRSVRGEAQAGDVAIVPDFGARARVMIELLQSLGVAVHLPSPEGKVLAEVHRPDGSVTVGMLGAAVEGKTRHVLHDLYTERMRLGEHPEEGPLAELKTRESAFLRHVLRKAEG